MELRVFPNVESLAREAARFMAMEATRAIEARGRCVMALSGGTTPWLMLRALAGQAIQWERLDIVQVDERVAPSGAQARSLTHLRASLGARIGSAPAARVHPMPVESDDLAGAAGRYASTLANLAGTPAVLDIVHLGLGPDGHTASLVPGDPALCVNDSDVALAGPYQGTRRMTLTYPIINRARSILWLVSGDSKAKMLPRLIRSDPTIPAGRVEPVRARVFCDRAARGDA